MKSVRPLLWSLLFIVSVVVVVQNLSLFTHKEALRLNLLIKEYQTGPIFLTLYFLGFFLIGLLISYFYGVGERFKAKRTIRSHLKTIRRLEEEIRVLKDSPVQIENTPSKGTENA
jgi:uncharacterized integral membrane protein